MPIIDDLKKLNSSLDNATQKLLYTNASKKQKEIIDFIYKYYPSLIVTSTTRENAPKSSGHSTFNKKAVDFKSDKLPDLFYAWQGLQKLKPSYSVSLGLNPANKHLHVSNDDRYFRFLEIARPDKNGFVKVVSLYDKDYPKFVEKAKFEYGVSKKSVSQKLLGTSEELTIPILSALGFFFLVFKKGKK